MTSGATVAAERRPSAGGMEPGDRPLLEVHDLRVMFAGAGSGAPAVDGVDLCVAEGELLALVGESGAGKSTTALSLLGLLGAGAHVEGSVRVGGGEVVGASAADLRRVRGGVAALVPQEAGGSLDPLMRVAPQIVEQVRAHRDLSRGEARAMAVEALGRAGLDDPEGVARSYPHELSGGMRQRALIALAISCEPRLLVCDEPTSALDRTTAARIVALLDELRARDMGVLLVSHDLGLVARVADRVAVMYAGRIVEAGRTGAVLSRPSHPYTASLVGAVPWVDWEPPSPGRPMRPARAATTGRTAGRDRA